jgi:hypothetical protein
VCRAVTQLTGTLCVEVSSNEHRESHDRPGMVVHICQLSTWEADAGGSQI